MEPSTLERKIFFFRAVVGAQDDGKPQPFDPSPALAELNNLPFTNGAQGRYLLDHDGDALCVLPGPNSSSDSIATLRFCRIRRNALPQLEQGGCIRDLNIAPNEGLLESIHVAFFPNNIVGIDYNHFGPRLSRLGLYLSLKSKGVIPCASFYPIIRNDIAKQLDRFGEIRLFDFKIRPSYIDIVRLADHSLADALDANAKILDDPDEVSVTLKPSKESRISSRNKIINFIRSLLSREDLRENARIIQVKGKCNDTDRVETLDLLRDHLVSSKRILRMNPRSRALNPDFTFEVIAETYQELKDNLESSPGVES